MTGSAPQALAENDPAIRSGGRADNRRQALLDAAARRFRDHGYEGASMRDIAGDVGMLAGSMYYHFSSKEELLVAVHAEGVRHFEGAVERALVGQDDPWQRLQAAASAHLETLLGEGDYTQVVIAELPRDNPPLRARLIQLRDAYEALFRRLIGALDLAPECDPGLVRLMLFGALNTSPTWYRPGHRTPAELGAAFVRLLKQGVDHHP